MVALATDKLLKVGNPGSATTLSSPGYTIGATSITVGSTSNWSTDTGVAFAIDEAKVVNGVEVQVAGTYNEYVGTVASGTSVTNVAWVLGSGDRDYASGALTRVYIPVSAERENRIVEWGTVEHDQDGTHAVVTATSVTATGAVQGATVTSTGDVQLRSTSLETIRSETEFDYVASGGVITGDAYGSTLNASTTAVTAYINGRRGTLAAVTARAYTASKDTYVDILSTAGVLSYVYTEVANNAASPALAANSIRLAIVVTGASNIASVASINQGQEFKVLPIASSTPYAVTDSLGNLICPRDPSRKILGYRQIVTGFGPLACSTTAIDITALSVPVIVPTGRKVKITVDAIDYLQTGGIGTIWPYCLIKESTTTLAQKSSAPSAANIPASFGASYVGTTSSGAHTYKASLVHNAAGPNFTIEASASGPTYILVELV